MQFFFAFFTGLSPKENLKSGRLFPPSNKIAICKVLSMMSVGGPWQLHAALSLDFSYNWYLTDFVQVKGNSSNIFCLNLFQFLYESFW